MVVSLAEMFGGGVPETFFGVPKAAPGAVAGAVTYLAADMATPYASVGAYCAGGPAAIRAAAAAYAANFAHVNFDLGGPVAPEGVAIVDAGEVPTAEGDAAGNRAQIGAAVGAVLDSGGVPLLVGGDDSLPIPMLEAYGGRGRDIWILQIDAHVDWRDAVQGERLGLSSTMRRASEMGHVAGIVQVGQRGIGSARMSDKAEAEAWGVIFVPGGEVARSGVGRAVAAVPAGADVVICLDVDALDPAVMPAVIGRTPGGLTYWQVLGLVEGVAAKARIAGFDMVEFMPDRDIDGQGAMVAAGLLAAVTGIVARQAAARDAG